MKQGTVLVKPESVETYTVEETKPLTGVYNINRGYAVFNKVVILCESDEYYIVQEGDDYGLSNYDHICTGRRRDQPRRSRISVKYQEVLDYVKRPVGRSRTQN